jgi:acetyl-CoA carboxylase biotin carboxylase subunit
MSRAGLPLLPGTAAPVLSPDEGVAAADRIGYPLIIKAVAGGGGRGMTVVRHPRDFRSAYAQTTAAAQATFRDGRVYLERFLAGARHVEVQVLCDAYGNGVHLGERDCSVQRRHQKLIEETPCTRLSPTARAAIGAAAVRAALAIGYTGAGTLEFLYEDAADQDGSFYFMEMNARIQVEHPVTEMVTGIDLVAEQIRIAAGQPLRLAQDDVRPTGAAIECRINAEDPARDFAPTPGVLERLELPGGPWTRTDSGYAAGGRVGPHYDPLIAKVIVWAPDRAQALSRMDRALREVRVRGKGMACTAEFHRAVLRHPAFRAGDHTVHLVDDLLAGRAYGDPPRRPAAPDGVTAPIDPVAADRPTDPAAPGRTVEGDTVR